MSPERFDGFCRWLWTAVVPTDWAFPTFRVQYRPYDREWDR